MEFAPASYVEQILVEQMVVAQWRLMRAWSLERAAICHAARHPLPGSDCPTRDAVAAFQNPAPIRAFNQLEMRYERQFSRSLDKLFKLRARRRANDENEPNEPENRNESNDVPVRPNPPKPGFEPATQITTRETHRQPSDLLPPRKRGLSPPLPQNPHNQNPPSLVPNCVSLMIRSCLI